MMQLGIPIGTAAQSPDALVHRGCGRRSNDVESRAGRGPYASPIAWYHLPSGEGSMQWGWPSTAPMKSCSSKWTTFPARTSCRIYVDRWGSYTKCFKAGKRSSREVDRHLKCYESKSTSGRSRVGRRQSALADRALDRDIRLVWLWSDHHLGCPPKYAHVHLPISKESWTSGDVGGHILCLGVKGAGVQALWDMRFPQSMELGHSRRVSG